MAKFANYIMLMGGFLMIFYFLNLLDGGVTGNFLDLLLQPENVRTSLFVIQVTGIMAATVGIFTSLRLMGFKADMAIVAPLLPVILAFGWDFLAVFTNIASASSVLAVMVLSPIILVYVFTVIEWWRGVTT